MNRHSANAPRSATIWKSAVSVWLASALITLSIALTASARNWTEFSASSRSFIQQDRGRWSVGPDDQLFDLAGPWRLTDHGSSSADTITIPFAWSNWQGRVLLTRHFKLPIELSDRRWKLVVDGASQSVEITLNNQSVSSRAGDDLSFQIDLGPRVLRFGDNVNQINLLLSNRLAIKNYPPLRGSIYARERYGGVTRGLYLVSSPAVGIEDLQLARISSAGGKVEALRATVSVVSSRADLTVKPNEAAASEARLTVRAFRNRDENPFYTSEQIVKAGSDIHQAQYFDVPLPQEPSVDSDASWTPTLYRVEAEYADGRVRHRLSAKTATGFPVWRNGWFQTAAGPLELRCVNYIGADPLRGPLLDSLRIEDDVRMIIESGANSARINQGRAHPFFLECCEQAGVMVLEELPVFQAPDHFLTAESFIRSAIEQLSGMIARDGSYACIAGWGLGSELNPPDSKNSAYYNSLVKAARALDQRPVYFSTPLNERVTVAPADFAVLEFTEHGGLLINHLPKSLDCDRPVVVGGVRALLNASPDKSQRGYSPDAGQAAQVLNRIAAVKELPWSRGVIVGDFTDWVGLVPSISSPSRGHGSVYASGLVTADRKPRLSFRKLQELWILGDAEPPAAAPLPTSESPFLLIAGMLMLLILFLSLRQNNILRVNIFRSLASPQGLFQDIGHLRYFQSSQTWLLSGLISGSVGLTLAGWLYAQRGNPATDWMVGYLAGSDSIIQWIATLFWQPYRAFLFFWLLAFVLIWVAALYAAFFCSLTRLRCSLSQSIDFIVWSMIVLIGLLPLGMFAGRIYSGEAGFLLTTLATVLLIWGAARLLWAYKSYTRRSLALIAFIWLGPGLIAGAVLFGILNATLSICEYWEFFQSTIIQ